MVSCILKVLCFLSNVFNVSPRHRLGKTATEGTLSTGTDRFEGEGRRRLGDFLLDYGNIVTSIS